MRIGVDLMGGDSPPSSLFEAILQAARQLDPNTSLIVFATQEVIDEISHLHYSDLSSPSIGRIVFYVVADFITMDDDPLFATRHKKNSSMLVGIRLLKKKYLDAFISSGNTGALTVAAALSLPMLPGIKRPALLAVLPSQKGKLVVLDVGGNVSCKALHLVQFAHMGASYLRSYLKIEQPVVGLLNIGVESKKGTKELRQAYQILEEYSKTIDEKDRAFYFAGNIEGREVFQGKVDLLVTDGFTGNVFLKSIEGVALFIFEYLKRGEQGNFSGPKTEPLNELQKSFNYAEYPGAILCGIDRLVLKCHGNSSTNAMLKTILEAVDLVQNNFISQLRKQLEF